MNVLTQVGEQSGLGVNIDYWSLGDSQGRNYGHMIVKVWTHTYFPASNSVAVVVLSHVQLSASSSN